MILEVLVGFDSYGTYALGTIVNLLSWWWMEMINDIRGSSWIWFVRMRFDLICAYEDWIWFVRMRIEFDSYVWGLDLIRTYEDWIWFVWYVCALIASKYILMMDGNDIRGSSWIWFVQYVCAGNNSKCFILMMDGNDKWY